MEIYIDGFAMAFAFYNHHCFWLYAGTGRSNQIDARQVYGLLGHPKSKEGVGKPAGFPKASASWRIKPQGFRERVRKRASDFWVTPKARKRSLFFICETNEKNKR